MAFTETCSEWADYRAMKKSVPVEKTDVFEKIARIAEKYKEAISNGIDYDNILTEFQDKPELYGEVDKMRSEHAEAYMECMKLRNNLGDLADAFEDCLDKYIKLESSNANALEVIQSVLPAE